MGWMARWSVLVSVVVLSSGCVVSKGTHEAVLAKLQATEAERDQLGKKVKELEANLNQKSKELAKLTEGLSTIEKEKGTIEKEKKETEAKLAALEQDMKTKVQEAVQLKRAVEEIRMAKDKEVEELRFKVRGIQVRAEALLETIKEALIKEALSR